MDAILRRIDGTAAAIRANTAALLQMVEEMEGEAMRRQRRGGL